MLSELRTRLQAGKRAPAKQPVPNPGPERLETGMAWETPVVESLYETRSQLSATDAEWREKIYQQLLKVMDLSLLDSLEPADAVWQIREICQRLLDEHAAPVSAAAKTVLPTSVSVPVTVNALMREPPKACRSVHRSVPGRY